MLIHHLLGSTRRRLLCTTMCCLLVSTTNAYAAFDPNEGAEDIAPVSSSVGVRKRIAPAPMMMINRSVTPLYPQTSQALVPAVDEVAMPKPLYPSRATATATPMQSANANVPVGIAAVPVEAVESNTLGALPPVSPEVKAKAESMLAQESEEMQMAGYIAPPPPLPDMAPVTAVAQPNAPQSTASNEAAPVDIIDPDSRNSTGKQMNTAVTIAPPPPVVGSAAPAPATTSALSAETKEILGRIPSRVGEAPAPTMSRTTVSRVSPAVADLIPNLQKEAEYEQVGLKITVSRNGFDSAVELGRAYEALIAGDSEMAVDIYQNIIAAEPQNQDALFGLAATYHRAGELTKARPLYGALLRMNPNHREALNNFLVLVSEESPEEALFELQKLAERNPEFSPIRAQMGLVLEKLGQHDMARDQMLKAIRLAPENLVYKYNLAIMMDRQGRYGDASALYKLLVDAALRGESIPASLEDIQKRLTYINTASLDTRGS